MTIRRSISTLLIPVVAVATLATLHEIPAQTGASDAGPNGDAGQWAGTDEDAIPPAAMLTDRGTALVERLKQLRRAESRMGPKHPSLPDLRDQIADVREQLKAWGPAPNPFRETPRGEQAAEATKSIPQMNEEDLRQVVIALAAEVESLRQRVETLETQIEGHGR